MYEYLKNKKILVVVAHPDDEVLGLGATMNKLINDYNCEIRALILGEGITSRSETRNLAQWENELKRHRNNILKAKEKIGYSFVNTYQLPDNRFDSVDLLDIIKIIEKEKEQFKPEIIFTHHGGDLNIDHRRTFEAVITATRPMQNEYVRAIITFETPSGTEWQASTDPHNFIPNLFFEISEENLKSKIDAMECYDYEKRKYPHPRSPEALEILAKRWGVVVGKEYAEAFCLVRGVF